MSERLPPAIAIFLSETTRRRVMPHLGSRVQALRFDPAHTIANAFVDELAQAMAQAAERLRPDVAPALTVAIVGDPAPESLIGLIKRACPNVTFVPLWIGVHQSPRKEGTTFLLGTQWRGASLQGGALGRAFQALVLAVLATETSRVDPQTFDCFTRLRFHSPGRTYKVAIDHTDLPNFDQLATEQLRQAALSSYFPEIDARAKAAAGQPIIPAPTAASRQAIEPTVIEPFLASAIARANTLEQAAAILGDWATKAPSPHKEILNDLQIALLHWTNNQPATNTDKPLADALFKLHPFPLLHELTKHPRSQRDFQQAVAERKTALIQAKRAELDQDFYALLPNDWNANQRLAEAAQLSNTSNAASLTVTRHFPANLIQDTREEILDLANLSAVLYSMELRPA